MYASEHNHRREQSSRRQGKQRGLTVDDLTLATLHADRERLAKALHDYEQAERSIQPSETDIAALRASFSSSNTNAKPVMP